MVQTVKPVANRFKDVDAESTKRARAAVLSGGSSAPLTPPSSARASEDKKGKKYVRWGEQVTVTLAYRTTAKSGLMDVVVQQQIRQSEVEKNNGRKFFAHFYLNNGDEISEGHETMNEKSNGAIASLLTAAGLMPDSDTMKASLLAKLFPEKGKPGDAPSLLVGKSVIANVVQETESARDKNTNKVLKNEDGTDQISKRDRAESYLPDVVEAAEEE